MDGHEDVLDLVRQSAARKLLFLPLAVRQMSRPDRMITREEVQGVIEDGEVIEDYPNDQRGHSCLLLGFGAAGRPIHVACAPKGEYLAIITAYVPDPRLWTAAWTRRR